MKLIDRFEDIVDWNAFYRGCAWLSIILSAAVVVAWTVVSLAVNDVDATTLSACQTNVSWTAVKNAIALFVAIALKLLYDFATAAIIIMTQVERKHQELVESTTHHADLALTQFERYWQSLCNESRLGRLLAVQSVAGNFNKTRASQA